jgi:hypothetical protein
MTYKINDDKLPLYRQLGMPEAVVHPYQECINGLLAGRALNVIAPLDFERHVNRIITRLLRIRTSSDISVKNYSVGARPARAKSAGARPARAKKNVSDAALFV